MATIQSLSQHVTAVLNMPSKIGDQIIKAKFVAQKLTGNTDFPLPYPANVCTLVQFNADLAALDVAETGALNRTKGASALRDAALEIVFKDLKGLKTMVQATADNNHANAHSIIQNAGFDVKSPSIKQKQKNEAISDNVPGVVDLTADGKGAHEWQMSVDQIALTTLNATTVANLTVSGLNSGDVLYFRNRKIGRIGGENPWTPWFQVRVK